MPGASQQLLYSKVEVLAAGEQARESGVWLAAHAQASEAVKMGVRAGFHVLYHCTYADSEALDMLEEARDRIFIGPAIGIIQATLDANPPPHFDMSHMKRSAAEVLELQKKLIPELKRRGLRILPGGDYGFPFNPNGRNARDLELFVQHFVEEAMRDDPLPLMLTCGGPLTNVAAALRLRPEIATRMTVVWIGGSSAADGGIEYNLSTDIESARQVLEKSTVPVWQIPEGEYKRFQISVAEMGAALRPISPLAAWLYDKYAALPPFVQLGGSITLGDSPVVSLTSFSTEASQYETRTVRTLRDDASYGAELVGRTIRMDRSLDVRLKIADFLALLRLDAARR